MKNIRTFDQAIAARGIDESKAIAALNRRARYALQRDRVKVFASTPLGAVPVFGRRDDGKPITVHDVAADLNILKLAKLESDQGQPLITTRDYVAAWCRLNHLKG